MHTSLSSLSFTSRVALFPPLYFNRRGILAPRPPRLYVVGGTPVGATPAAARTTAPPVETPHPLPQQARWSVAGTQGTGRARRPDMCPVPPASPRHRHPYLLKIL